MSKTKNRQEFKEALKMGMAIALSEKMGNAVIEESSASRYNRGSSELLLVTDPSEKECMMPTVNVDMYYAQYQQGRSLKGIVREIAMMFGQKKGMTEQVDLSRIESFQNARDHISIRLSDGKKNREYLREAVTMDCGDFTATYHLSFNEPASVLEEKQGAVSEGSKGMFSTVITQELLAQWGVSVEEIHEAALMNMKPVMMPIMGMVELFSDGKSTQNLLKSEAVNMPGFYVISNESCLYGASMIANKEIMKKVCRICGCSGYILPSTVHEVMFVPECMGMPLSMMRQMVREANACVVSPEDLLSDEVQWCDGNTGAFVNAVVHEKEK